MPPCNIRVAVTSTILSPPAEYTALTAADAAAAAGAAACFVGRVRGGEVLALTLEHYPGMTQKSLHAIASAAAARWPLAAARITHRAGDMRPGDPIVFVGALSAHRAAAFAACAFMTDHLKTEAPFWKKEHTAAGARWLTPPGPSE